MAQSQLLQENTDDSFAGLTNKELCNLFINRLGPHMVYLFQASLI